MDLAVALGQLGLGVEQVHLARPAVLHQHDDGPGLGREVRRLRCRGRAAAGGRLGRGSRSALRAGRPGPGCRSPGRTSRAARGGSGLEVARIGEQVVMAGSSRDVQELARVQAACGTGGSAARALGRVGRQLLAAGDSRSPGGRAARAHQVDLLRRVGGRPRASAEGRLDPAAPAAAAGRLGHAARRRHAACSSTKASLSIVSDCRTTADDARQVQLVARTGWSKTLSSVRVVIAAGEQVEAAPPRGWSASAGPVLDDDDVRPAEAPAGTGGPPSVRSSLPLTARIASRTASDSSRRSRMRHRSSLSGSVAARRRRRRPSRRLAVGGGGHQQPEQRLELASPAGTNSRRQPVEQLGVRRLGAGHAEVVARSRRCPCRRGAARRG